jgi:hypothetical protein
MLPRSAALAGPRAFPRTDLKTLRPWTSFMNDIEDVIHTKMATCDIPHGTQITVGSLRTEPPVVQSEEALRSHADVELHAAVRGVARKLGVQGFFTFPNGGNITIVGEPDFSWISGGPSLHPKLVVRISPPTLTQRHQPLMKLRRWSTRQNGWQTSRIYPLSLRKRKTDVTRIKSSRSMVSSRCMDI